jgi:hypothetical protein
LRETTAKPGDKKGLRMSAKDIFALIVRLAGLGFVIAGVLDVLGMLATVAGIPTGHTTPIPVIGLAAIEYFVIGLVLLVTAKAITRLVYGRDG